MATGLRQACLEKKADEGGGRSTAEKGKIEGGRWRALPAATSDTEYSVQNRVEVIRHENVHSPLLKIAASAPSL